MGEIGLLKRLVPVFAVLVVATGLMAAGAALYAWLGTPDVGTAKQQLTLAFETYNSARKSHEKDLRRLIDQGVNGILLRRAIQDFKQNRFTSAQTVFTSPEVQKQLMKSESKQPEDILRTAYWLAPLPEKASGVLDYTAREAEREKILNLADQMGIARDLVRRPATIEDKVVEAVVREFEADQETLKEYWSIPEYVAQQYYSPEHSRFYLAWRELGPTEKHEMQRKYGELINSVENDIQKLQRAYRASNYVVDGLLAKWEYSTALPQTVGGQLQREAVLSGAPSADRTGEVTAIATPGPAIPGPATPLPTATPLLSQDDARVLLVNHLINCGTFWRASWTTPPAPTEWRATVVNWPFIVEGYDRTAASWTVVGPGLHYDTDGNLAIVSGKWYVGVGGAPSAADPNATLLEDLSFSC